MLKAGNRRRSDDEHYTLIVGHRRILFYHSCRYLLLTQHFCRIHLHCAALAENDRSEFMTQVEAYVLEQQLAVVPVADGVFSDERKETVAAHRVLSNKGIYIRADRAAHKAVKPLVRRSNRACFP